MATPSILEDQLAKIADMMLGKMNPGIVGGAPHVPLSAEELAKQPKKTMEEVAEEYLAGKDSTNFPFPGIHVTSDLNVFVGNAVGENSRDNHLASNKSLTFLSFKTPGYVAPTKD